MTNEEILRRGHAAMRFLADEDFTWFVRDLERRVMSASFIAPKSDPDERQSVYFQLKSIHDLVVLMEQWSSEAQLLLEALQQPQENPDEY